MITKVIKLDINKNLYEKIKAKQGDTKSRFLLFQLLDGSMPFNLENRSVRAYMLKPDSTEVFNDLIINNRNTGHCTLELTNQVLAVAGIVKIELMIIENDKKITSSIFELQVDKSINSENSIVSTNEFNALLNGLASLSEYDNYKEKAKKVPELEENIQELGSQLDKKAKQSDLEKTNNNVVILENEKATKVEVEVERKRIDLFTKLPNGSTTGDAELIDGRVGADGITYDNIGGAVRTNIKRLMDISLEKANNLLDPTTLELGDIGSWNGSTINTNSPATDKIRIGVIEVVEGNTYQFVRDGSVMTVAVFSVFDSKGNFIQTVSAVGKKYTIPTGIDAKYIRARFSGTDINIYNGDNPSTTLQFKLFTENMSLEYEKYNEYKSILVEKTVFNEYKDEMNNIIYFDDKIDNLGNKIKGVISRQNLSTFTGGGYEHIEISCSEGERYLLSGYNSNSWDHALYIFVGNSNNVISYYNGTSGTIINDLSVTVPVGATKLIVNNDNTKNVLEVYKLIATDLQRKIVEVFNSESKLKNDVSDLKYENTQLKNRVFKLENENPFAFKEFDKGYVTFVFDDGRYDWDKITSIFNEYGLKLCLAVPPSELDYNSNSLGLGAKTIKDIAMEVVERGGEVLCHSMVAITKDNVNDTEVMTQQFKTNKQLLEEVGFTIRGIIMAGGTGQLLGGTVEEGGDIFQKWSSQYYDYSDRYGMTPNYYNPRKALKDGSSAIISHIQSTITNKKWSVYYGHTIDGTETGLDETELRTVLQYCVDNNVTVVTYGEIYDKFKSTNLEKRLLALENK